MPRYKSSKKSANVEKTHSKRKKSIKYKSIAKKKSHTPSSEKSSKKVKLDDAVQNKSGNQIQAKAKEKTSPRNSATRRDKEKSETDVSSQEGVDTTAKKAPRNSEESGSSEDGLSEKTPSESPSPPRDAGPILEAAPDPSAPRRPSSPSSQQNAGQQETAEAFAPSDGRHPQDGQEYKQDANDRQPEHQDNANDRQPEDQDDADDRQPEDQDDADDRQPEDQQEEDDLQQEDHEGADDRQPQDQDGVNEHEESKDADEAERIFTPTQDQGTHKEEYSSFPQTVPPTEPYSEQYDNRPHEQVATSGYQDDGANYSEQYSAQTSYHQLQQMQQNYYAGAQQMEAGYRQPEPYSQQFGYSRSQYEQQGPYSQNGQNAQHRELDQMDNYIEQAGPNDFRAELVVPPELNNDPSLNFVGMMIGPSGHTQKQMEQSTGCNITVRGMGSTRNSAPLDPERPMYVLIKGDHRNKVRAGVSIVSELLSNKAKRDMLRQQQLALRSAQLSSTAQNYSHPSYYMQQMAVSSQAYSSYPAAALNSSRTPFQNAFKHSRLGGGQIIESIIIPATVLPLFTGHNQNVIDEISYYSGVKIDVKEVASNNTLAELILQGTNEQVTMGRKKLQNIMANDPAESMQPSSDHIFVPNTVVGLIIGKNGETIKKFMNDTNCKMKVTPEYMTDPDAIERKIVLFGNPNQCANAKYVINDLVLKHKMTSYSSTGNTNTRVEIVSVPCGCIGILIGKGGETIRAMGQRTNCRVQVVQYDENQLFPGGMIQNHDLRHVSLKGNDESLKKAKIEIQAIINEHAHRHGYEPPRLDHENGDTYLGLQPEQYKQYLEQMKSYCNMDKEQVHNYYRAVMSEIAKEPSEYAAQVKQFLMRASQASTSYYQNSVAEAAPMQYAQAQGQMASYGNQYGQHPQQQQMQMQQEMMRGAPGGGYN